MLTRLAANQQHIQTPSVTRWSLFLLQFTSLAERRISSEEIIFQVWRSYLCGKEQSSMTITQRRIYNQRYNRKLKDRNLYITSFLIPRGQAEAVKEFIKSLHPLVKHKTIV